MPAPTNASTVTRSPADEPGHAPAVCRLRGAVEPVQPTNGLRACAHSTRVLSTSE